MKNSNKEKIADLQKKLNEIQAEINRLNADKFNPESVEWVDLGLPSGRLWAKVSDAEHYTYDGAMDFFGDCLPRSSAFAELFEECNVEWDEERKGIELTGPNGNKLFFGAFGYKDSDGDVSCVGSYGYYWSRTPYCKSEKSFAPNSQTSARSLDFSSGYVYPLDLSARSHGFAVRACRESN